MALSLVTGTTEHIDQVTSIVGSIHGYREAGVLTVGLYGKLAALADVANEQELVFANGSDRYFAGIIKTVTPIPAPKGFRSLSLDCQDPTILASQDVIDVGGLMEDTSQSDRDRIVAQFAAIGTKGITVGDEVLELRATMPTEDYTGLTLAEFMDGLCQLTGGSWYVDFYKALHYFLAEAEAAPFALSDAPDWVSSFPYGQFSYPTDTVDFRNAVYYIPGPGGDAVPTWYEDAAAIAATAAVAGDDGRREACQRDDRITLQ